MKKERAALPEHLTAYQMAFAGYVGSSDFEVRPFLNTVMVRYGNQHYQVTAFTDLATAFRDFFEMGCYWLCDYPDALWNHLLPAVQLQKADLILDVRAHLLGSWKIAGLEDIGFDVTQATFERLGTVLLDGPGLYIDMVGDLHPAFMRVAIYSIWAARQDKEQLYRDCAHLFSGPFACGATGAGKYEQVIFNGQLFCVRPVSDECWED